jgi:GNAT superfamily N-acetyltransferase
MLLVTLGTEVIVRVIVRVIDGSLFQRLREPMSVTYFKRYRMAADLRKTQIPRLELDGSFELLPWHPDLLEAHADVKCRSFQWEHDANIFPCLGELDGCRALMREISSRSGFLPGVTWLAVHDQPEQGIFEYCGTIQGIRARTGTGSIQNVGITPDYRGRGVGTALILQALHGFYHAGVHRVFLEVTAENAGAIRLYRRVGFCHVRTLYKSVEVAYT